MRTLLLSLLLAPFPLFAQQTARVVTTVTKGAPAWRTWKNDACATNYPGTWSMDNSGTTGTNVTFLAPRDSTGAAPARVELVVREAKGLQEALTTSEKELHLDQVRVVEEERSDDQLVREIEAKQDGQDVRIRQSARAKDGKVYLLSFIARAADYEEARFLAEAMFNSFRFLP